MHFCFQEISLRGLTKHAATGQPGLLYIYYTLRSFPFQNCSRGQESNLLKDLPSYLASNRGLALTNLC